jgi:hypothetical protein
MEKNGDTYNIKLAYYEIIKIQDWSCAFNLVL